MTRVVAFFLAVVLVVVAAFAFLTTRPVELPSEFENAQVSDRCAKYRTIDTEREEDYDLGYGGRVTQLLHGCF